MAFTLDQLNALDAALAAGVKKVKYADKEVEYASTSEMLRIRDLMIEELGLSDDKFDRKFGEFNSGLFCNKTDLE